MKNLQKIQDIIIWYNQTGYKDLGIALLMDNYRKLATELAFFAECLGDTKIAYHKAYFLRKKGYIDKKADSMNFDNSATLSEVLAQKGIEAELKTECATEAKAQKETLILHQANKVLDAMSQHLSILKKEQYTMEKSQI